MRYKFDPRIRIDYESTFDEPKERYVAEVIIPDSATDLLDCGVVYSDDELSDLDNESVYLGIVRRLITDASL